MRRQRGDLGNGPVQLDELAGGLARLLIAHNDSAADAQVSIPPGLVQGAGVGGNAELDVTGRGWLLADGLESGCQGVDVAGNHANTVAGLVGLADGKGDDGAAIASDPVLAAGLDLAGPGVAHGELGVCQHVILYFKGETLRYHERKCTYLFVARLAQLGLEVVDGMEDSRVLAQEVAERLGEGLGLEVPHGAQLALVLLVHVPVDLADLVRRELGDAVHAGAVVERRATVHVCENKVLR